MTDREKLIALCEDVILSCKASLCADCEHSNIDRPHCLEVHFADHLLANGVVVREWIPVTERLPEGADGEVLCDTVLAYLDNGEAIGQVCPGWLNGDRWYLTVGDDDYYTVWGLGAVTHWMPLPEPPMRKGENDGCKTL